jgi:ankyrin
MTSPRNATALTLLAAVILLSGCVTNIHSAIERDEMDRLQRAVEQGQLDSRDWRDRTPLMLAAQRENLEMVRYLVNQGADINAATRTGGFTALRFACSNGNYEMAQFLINNGADVTQTNEFGWTPLHTAAKYGHPQLVKLLLSNGAQIDAETESGVTPARTAGQNGYVDITVYLLLRERDEQGAIFE